MITANFHVLLRFLIVIIVVKAYWPLHFRSDRWQLTEPIGHRLGLLKKLILENTTGISGINLLPFSIMIKGDWILSALHGFFRQI